MVASVMNEEDYTTLLVDSVPQDSVMDVDLVATNYLDVDIYAVGSPGNGINSTTVEYQLSTSGTTVPTGTWSSTIPTLVQGKYLWMRFTSLYTDTSSVVSYLVTYISENGATFTPSVDSAGNISWTNDKSLPNPTTQNIKGPKGDKGDKGDKGNTGDTGPYFTPSVNSGGDISWTNNGGLVNPTTQNIKGPKGDTGATGPAGYTPVKGTDYFTQQDIADLATYYEEKTNKVTSISSSSTNTQYPSAKCLYDLLTGSTTINNKVVLQYDILETL